MVRMDSGFVVKDQRQVYTLRVAEGALAVEDLLLAIELAAGRDGAIVEQLARVERERDVKLSWSRRGSGEEVAASTQDLLIDLRRRKRRRRRNKTGH